MKLPPSLILLMSASGFLAAVSLSFLHTYFSPQLPKTTQTAIKPLVSPKGLPRLDPLPAASEVWEWYSWDGDQVFEKVPVRLQAPAKGRMIVIDATDTGELVGWAGIPQRLGSESRATTGEIHAAPKDNPECTQAFTFPFVLAIRDDGGLSRAQLALIPTGMSKEEHRRDYSIKGFPVFAGDGFWDAKLTDKMSS